MPLIRHFGLELTQGMVVYNKFTISPFLASNSPKDEVVYNNATNSPFWPRAHPRNGGLQKVHYFAILGLELTQGRGGLQ